LYQSYTDIRITKILLNIGYGQMHIV